MCSVHKKRISTIDKLQANHFEYHKLIEFIIRNESIGGYLMGMIEKFNS